nr:dystrophin, isoforms A/C/F/G/H-like isoform X3 [Danaus plexippus plexippus]
MLTLLKTCELLFGPQTRENSYEREDVQKKTFAKWINSQLAKQGKPLVNDLFQDLRDGEVLLSLLEILTAQQFKRERGRMRVHHLNNVNAALRALAAAGVRLVNISSGDIVDGNPKLILGLVWSIILHWQVHYHLKELMSELQQTNLEKTLLAWCRNHTQDYAGVKVENFTSSWSDGLAFSALLHRFRPELFRYNDALGLSPSERLDRVFTLAQDHLGIDRLLDPEDVNTTNPDKKSIMMYVMCLFQSLPQTPASHESCDLEHGDGDEIGSPGDLGAEVGGGSCSASRPVSVATTCSVELGAYGAALEDALAALLLGEERLRDAPPPDEPEDVGSEQPPGRYLVTLKEYFHEHEKFLLELSEQQWRVGGVLEEGARLLREAALARDEAAEVRLQLRLLARRWEALRGAAMTRQADLHRALMRTQHDHLQRFRRWLTATEDRMSRMEAVSAPAGAALEATRALHADLRQQQPLVDALADCVLVVDDEDDRHEHQDGSDRPDLPLTSSDNVAAMEDELRALGERWSHACQWTLSRLQRLQRYVDLEHRADLLRDKVSTLENDLKQMEAYPAQEIGEVLERIRSLQRCGAELRVRRDELNELLRSLEEQDDDHTASQLADRADQCQDRLDALDLILRVQADRIRELGFDVDVSSELGGEVGGAGGTDEHVSKKPRLEAERAGVDFQAGYRAFNNWAAETENALLMCMEQLQTASGTEKATGEARTLLQRVTRESEERRADFSNVEEIQRRLAADQELAEEAKLHAQSIEEVKKRWEGIQKMLLDIRNTLNLLEDKDNVYKNIKAFESDLQDIHAWKDRMLKETATNNQLIHLRNKIRTLKQLEIKLKELNAQSIILLTKAFSKTHKDEVEADTKRINEAFEELFLHLCKKEVEIKIALNKKLSPIQTEDEYKAVQRKIQEMESQIISEHAIISTREEMAKKLEELKNMRRQFDDLQASYDAVVKEKRDKFEKGSLEELNLRSSVENLVLRFDDSKTILEQKIDKLEKGISLLERLEGEQNAVDSWLKGLHRFMDEHRDVPVGELQLLEELLDRSNKFLEEKSEYTARVEAIEEMKRTVLEDCEEVVAKTLKADTLRKRFDSLTEESLKTNEELRRALEKTEGLFRRVDDLETWLGRLRDDMPREDECGIEDSAQLYQMKMRFQTLKERCDDKTDEFRNLNEDGNEMLLNAGAPAVARRLTQLNARWTADTHAVYERYKVLAEAWLEAGELRAWLSAQAAWLDGLQRRLRPDTSRAARADAEDISDELYDLENYIANRDEARVSRIEAVARQLADAHIMPQWIRNETETLARRWDELRLQAAERSAELEAAAREAARCEVALDSLRQWLGTVRDGGHVPTSAEFADRRASLREVRTQEEAHRAAGRREAADRLRDQLELAERELVSLERRVSVSGAGPAAAAGRLPGDLAARLRRATETLEDVQRASGGLALHTHDPDEVRTQLRACLRFYRTLSEIKSEVESIIKTGRKTVEEGGAERQRALSAEIDALKELYNRLGAHVTEAKGRLEAALLAAREIQSDLASLGVWLRSAKVAGRHKLELEMSRMAAIRDKLQANYEELARGCDPAHLAGLRAQLDDVNEQWERLRRRADTGADPAEDRGEDPARGEDSAASATEADGNVLVEYENVTDTIKRRLESPVNSHETEKPEQKRSRIPLALKSPSPIKKEVQEGGARSRGSSMERRVRSPSGNRTDSTSTMSADSIEDTTSLAGTPPAGSAPATPSAIRKDSSTFNLLKDSDLFTQISKNKIVAKSPSSSEVMESQSCHVVEVKEHEIVKSTVGLTWPAEATTRDVLEDVETVETVVEFIPQTVDTVEIIEDTEEDEEEGAEERDSAGHFGHEPRTFVVEVKTLEHRMRPTIGILKRRRDHREKGVKVVRMDEDGPYAIPGEEREVMLATTGEGLDPGGQNGLMDDEVNEYHILDDRLKEIVDEEERDEGEATSEGIYTEVEEGQTRVREPLSSSTPVKKHEDNRAHVVGADHKGHKVEEHEQGSFTQTKVDQSSVDEISAIEEEKGEGVEQELEYEEDGDDEAAAARLEAAGEKMLRRLQVVLLTLAAVPAERDPAKRLEILKNQVGGVAPDAAALISRGDSLVYRLHGTRPALARRLQEVVQDPLRARWSALRAEAEHRRREALRAEDDLRELGARLEAVRRAGGGSAAAHDANRLRDLCRDLRDRRIAFPERAVADALAEYDAAREQRRGSDDHRHNLEERSEVVTRCNLEREAVSRALGSLRGSPLGGGDYDDFPLQEDALNEIKSAIDDIERSLAEVEGRGVGGEQAARVTDKLRNELTRLKEDYRERCDRWQRCAGTWARLYGALEEGGRQLDDLLAALDTVEEEGGACDHHRLAIWQEQLEECTRGADELKSLGGAVTAACGGALGEKVRGQIQEHERRRALAEERVRTLRTTSPTSVKERSRARRPETCATLARVRELLLTTSAHPADRASLAVRHSLVKAREEEVARALTTARGDERLELEQARASLSAHGQYVSHKLASLRKYSIRLDDALAWTQTIRDRITRGDLSGLREAVRDKEVEIGEVLENYNNIERECHAAKHSVCQEIRDRVQRLREDWREIRQDEAGGEIGE